MDLAICFGAIGSHYFGVLHHCARAALASVSVTTGLVPVERSPASYSRAEKVPPLRDHGACPRGALTGQLQPPSNRAVVIRAKGADIKAMLQHRLHPMCKRQIVHQAQSYVARSFRHIATH